MWVDEIGDIIWGQLHRERYTSRQRSDQKTYGIRF